MGDVSGVIKSIQDIMRKDVGVDGDAQRISQLVWMFFLKIFDDREAELELLEDDYKSPLPKHLRWRAWATDPEGMTGEELADFVNVQLFPYLKEKLPTTGTQGKRAQVVRSVFEDAYNYMKSGTLMRQVINKICEINFNNTDDRHTFGSIYEQILRDLQSAGNAGEFYTPRAVTRFIVNRVDPKLNEKVLDPACGTGGFLTCTIDHKREYYVNSAEDEALLQSTIFGVEKKALPHMLAVTNMILHQIDVPTNIRHDNTLARPYKDYGEKDRVNVIVTNPPFGGMEEDGIENNFPANYRTRETADLFMALIIKLLKDKGRAAVVLPDGFLFGEGMKTRLKQSLLEECNLHTIVRLPNGVFNPYTGIKTNLLFFTKGKPTKHVWYYEHPYPEGVKSYNKTKPMRFEEFQAEIDWWGNEDDDFLAREQTEQAWKVSVEDIVARNYNLDIKNPHVGKRVSHDPDELLHEYQLNQTAIADEHNQLKAILQEALNRDRGLPLHEVIIDSLDVWTSAVDMKSSARRGSNGNQEAYGVTKLRELILELAVRGKLLPQDHIDEPARVLLEKIMAEKERMIEEGLIKKKKPLPEIADDEKLFALPNGWEWSRLQDVSSYVQRGKGPRYADSGEVQVVSQKCIQWSGFDLSQARFVDDASLSGYQAERFLRSNDLLWNSTGTGTVGRINVLPEIDTNTLVADSHVTVIRPLMVSSQFLHCVIAAAGVQKRIEPEHENSLVSGTTNQVELNLSSVIQLVIPVPPLDEQHRIVSKVNELMALCDALDAHLNDAQTTRIHLADAIVEQAIT
jgi:type I restriction enzyme M protein